MRASTNSVASSLKVSSTFGEKVFDKKSLCSFISGEFSSKSPTRNCQSLSDEVTPGVVVVVVVAVVVGLAVVVVEVETAEVRVVVKVVVAVSFAVVALFVVARDVVVEITPGLAVVLTVVLAVVAKFVLARIPLMTSLALAESDSAAGGAKTG